MKCDVQFQCSIPPWVGLTENAKWQGRVCGGGLMVAKRWPVRKENLKDVLQEGGGQNEFIALSSFQGKMSGKLYMNAFLFSRAQVLHIPAIKSSYLRQFVAVWNISLFHPQFERTMKASEIMIIIVICWGCWFLAQTPYKRGFTEREGEYWRVKWERGTT